jgi:hypothetical protein
MRRREDSSSVIKRYNQMLDDLSDHDYPFKDCFGIHRIKVDESEMDRAKSFFIGYEASRKGVTQEDAIEIV